MVEGTTLESIQQIFIQLAHVSGNQQSEENRLSVFLLQGMWPMDQWNMGWCWEGDQLINSEEDMEKYIRRWPSKDRMIKEWQSKKGTSAHELLYWLSSWQILRRQASGCVWGKFLGWVNWVGKIHSEWRCHHSACCGLGWLKNRKWAEYQHLLLSVSYLWIPCDKMPNNAPVAMAIKWILLNHELKENCQVWWCKPLILEYSGSRGRRIAEFD